jgi:carbonic anhydrase
MVTAEQVLSQLHAGNLRFLSGQSTCRNVMAEQRKAMLAGQQPIAALLTCSDSRIAPEVIFDAGLGELFVVRVGGAVLDGASLASLEFAVVELSVPLILIVGHQHCGTVALAASGAMPAGSIGTLTSGFATPLAQMRASGQTDENAAMIEITERHVLQTAETLPNRSFVISDAVARGTCTSARRCTGSTAGRWSC